MLHRRRGRARPSCSCSRTSARNSCPTTTRASSASTSACRRAPASPRTDEFVQPIEDALRKLPEVQTVLSSVGVANANFYIGLTPLEEPVDLAAGADATRARHAAAVPGRAHQRVRRHRPVGGVAAPVAAAAAAVAATASCILIQGPDIDQLQKYVTELMDKLKTIPGVVDVDTNFEPTQPELRVVTDRVRAADLGVSIDSLASNLRTLVGGEEVSKFRDGDDQISVQLRLDEQYRNEPGGHRRRCWSPPAARQDRARQRRRATALGDGPRLHRPLQPSAPDLGLRQPRQGAARRRGRRGPAQGERAAT